MSDTKRFKPKLLTILSTYSGSQFLKDGMAGMMVGVVALPLAIAFAIASGVSPEKGVITAIIAGFLISMLGGSRVQIGGPTAAFVVIVTGIIQDFGMTQLLIATIMAGIFLVAMGLLRIGSWIRFVPTTVVVGFTSGIAVVIFSTQIRDALGLPITHLPSHFPAQLIAYSQTWNQVNGWALGLTGLTIGLVIACQRVLPKIPGLFVALVTMSFLASVLGFPVETIGSRFGELSTGIPIPKWPENVDLTTIRHLIMPAFTIALLGAMESLLSAVVADGMIGGKHRPNTELVAQGVANIVTPLFGGIPATGAIARTTINVKSGGRTPVAGMVHALTLLICFLFLMPYARLIPMPVLAGILMVVAYHMSEWREFGSLLSSPKPDVVILLATFLLTLIADLVVAIQIGMIGSAFLVMSRMSEVSDLKVLDSNSDDHDDHFLREGALSRYTIPSDVIAVEVTGAFFFGAAAKFERILTRYLSGKRTLILKMDHVVFIDASGVRVLRRVLANASRNNVSLILVEMSQSCQDVLRHSAYAKEFDAVQFYPSMSEALRKCQR